MKHYVYRLDDPITKEFYFGSRSCKCEIEDDDYMGSYLAWKPEDKSRLVKTILNDKFTSRESATQYESKTIKENIDNLLNRNYNIPNEGFHTLGYNHTEETREKIRIKRATQIISDEVLQMLRTVNTGKKFSEETKRKMSKSAKEYYQTHKTWNEGKTDVYSTESLKKMSEIKKGKALSEETRKKIGNANRNPSEETRNKMSESHRGVVTWNKGKHHSDDTKRKQSETMKNKPKLKCPHCGNLSNSGNASRWHFDNCKLKK